MNSAFFGVSIGVPLEELEGCVSRLRGDGGRDESVEPGKLWWSMRKYSGLAKLAASSGSVPRVLRGDSGLSSRRGLWQ